MMPIDIITGLRTCNTCHPAREYWSKNRSGIAKCKYVKMHQDTGCNGCNTETFGIIKALPLPVSGMVLKYGDKLLIPKTTKSKA